MNNTLMEYQSEINACKQLLTNSDYMALKYAEGAISEDDYAPVKAKRQELRDRINTLEELIADLPADAAEEEDVEATE